MWEASFVCGLHVTVVINTHGGTMTRQTWLPDVLRAAGLTVHEVDGWRTRGDEYFLPRGIICHETRGSRNSTDAGEIRVLLEGSETAPPPIAQLYLSRTGHWHVIAAGRCNHVKVGWAGPFRGLGNTYLLGIEAQHALDEPWADVQYDSYVRGVRAIREHTGWGIAGHKEHQPAGYPGNTSIKTDPGFDMDKFRRHVADWEDFMAALSDQQQRDLLKMVTAINARVEALKSLTPSIKASWSSQNPEATDSLPIVGLLKGLADREAPTAGENADALLAALSGVSDHEVVDVLRAVLGADRAAEIGRLLAA